MIEWVVTALLLLAAVASQPAALAGEPSGRWSHRFEPATNLSAPLAVLGGRLVAGQHRFKDGEWRLLGNGIQPQPSWIGSVLADGGNLYISGSHRADNGFSREFVAKWDGYDWTLLPIETYSRFGIPLAMFNGDLYVAGEFPSVDGGLDSKVLRWDGTEWKAVGEPLPGQIRALAVFEGALYAGGGTDEGDRDEIGSGMLARWDGESWAHVGAAVNGAIESLLVQGDRLYAGGCFSTVGTGASIAATHIASWNGTSWAALGSGLGSALACGASDGNGRNFDNVMTMTFHDGDLVVAGNFDHSGGVAMKNLARWDGQQWSGFGEGYEYPIESLAVVDRDLFATGAYADLIDGAAIPGVARWNGTSWRAVVEPGAGVSLITVLESSGDDVYAGGYFRTAGGTAATAIARWNGIVWEALGDRLDGYIFDIAVLGEAVFVSGSVRTSPHDPYEYGVARWDGTSWAVIGGSPEPFYEIAAFQGEIYGARSAGQYGSVLARWNGQTWKTLVELEKGQIGTLEAGDKLYVSGDLGTIGDVEYASVASWDGDTWEALPSLRGYVSSLAWSGTHLFAGGDFRVSDDFVFETVAHWDGSGWTALGDSADFGFALAMAASGDDVFVDSQSLLIDGAPYDGLAHWDGAAWRAVGRMRAYAMTFVGDKLYVAGRLEDAPGNNPETVGLYALGQCGNGVLDSGEQCDHGIEGTGRCCNVNTCRLASSGSICRPLRGPCDRIETCSGTSDDCPADEIQPGGFVCREPADGCHGVGQCDGVGLTCSVDPIPPCSDGDFCNGIETCTSGGACQTGLVVVCDDGDECTIDFCAEHAERCGWGLAPGPGCTRCGDIDYDGAIYTSDALQALRGAVGIDTCPPFPCDFDGNGSVTTADALRILKVAVGVPVDSACPGDTGEWPDDEEPDGEQPDGQ